MNNSSLWQDAIRRLLQNKAAIFGGVVIIIMSTLAIFAPFVAPYSYEFQFVDRIGQPPSAEHWLGTDSLGRDLLSRIIYGARVSLMVGFVATTVALLIGVSWGVIAGYSGGRVDSIMMRIVDILYGLPFIMSRIVRAQVITLKNQEFVQAAQAMGVSNFAMFRRHILPNILGPIAVYATLTIPSVMLLESFLSFLGLGVPAEMSSWGSLIKDGVVSMQSYPWILIFSGLTFSITLFALNFFGDGLRDALDPKTAED